MKIIDALNVGFSVLTAIAQAEAGQPVSLKPIDVTIGSEKVELDITAKIIQ